jgi:hypothetical protein
MVHPKSIRLVALGAAMMAALLPAPDAAHAGNGHRLVSVSGRTVKAGLPARVDILLDVPLGADATALARDALAVEHASPIAPGPSTDFALSGLRWRRFFDRDKKNNLVDQAYNPDGEPVTGIPVALQTDAALWTDVPSATFALRFAGTTTAHAAFDNVNVVEWPVVWTHEPFALAITLTFFESTTGFILDSDIQLNRNVPFFSDTSPLVAFDVERVLLHEGGHLAGLEHSADPTAVMFASLPPGPVSRALAPDDVAAISTLYPLDFVPLPKEKAPKPPPPPPFDVVTTLGAPAPGGGFFDLDFQPYALTDKGEIAFAAGFFDPVTGLAGEGAFLATGSEIVALARTGDSAPGGGVLGAGVWVNIGLSKHGEAAFAFALDPFLTPFGLNGGVYRYDGTLTPVVVPFATPAPGGGAFLGAYTHATIDDHGWVTFAGIVSTAVGTGDGLGLGLYTAGKRDRIAPLVVPGDPAPGGGTFDLADVPSVTDDGVAAFGGHVHGEECITTRTQDVLLHCDESLYLRRSNGKIVSLVHQGDPAPGGGVFRSTPFGPVINAKDDVVFVGDLTPAPERLQDLGVFLARNGAVVPIAVPGTEMPGGGHLVTTAHQYGNWELNDNGVAAFSALLDTDTLGFGTNDTGLYRWRDGSLELVARTGMQVAGLGTLLSLSPPNFVQPFSGALLNNKGRIVFQATFIAPAGSLVTALLQTDS